MMAKYSKKSKLFYIFVRCAAVCLFLGGFIYQTLQFLFLYWTYPTVVDIQQSSPSYLEVPAFTFCNRVGYLYENICEKYGVQPCASPFFTAIFAETICRRYPFMCINGTLPDDYQFISYGKFMERYEIRPEDVPDLAVPLEDYLNCTIEFAGKVEKCNMENVLGSFYSVDDLPQFCYTIYSLWGKPNKKRDLIPKGATMKFHIFANYSGRPEGSVDADGYIGALYNPPCDVSVQVAVHSPYFLPSPYLEGSAFKGGRAYEIRIKLSESHLLPLPYQTNCTDYMTTWMQRGGKAPINQLSLIQECRINKTFEEVGCIPISLDYPHEHNICKTCLVTSDTCDYNEPPNKCTLLADSYNQPCDSVVYEVEKEDKAITIFDKIESDWTHESDGLRLTFPSYDCEGDNIWKPECSTIDIYVPFDRYEITNITYNPKFESLELFSVIGGYMGMWLGISLLTVFDLFVDVLGKMTSYFTARRKKQSRIKKVRTEKRRNFENESRKLQPTHYNVW